MTTARTGPPDGEGRPHPWKPATTAESDNSTYATKPSAATRQCRRNSGAWLFRDGFRRGAIDALRLAARRIDDPHALVVLDGLADRYELAGGDS
jgi:hypothetical protein